jgi:hypothetical protein
VRKTFLAMLVLVGGAVASALSHAAEAGFIKTIKGQVHIERGKVLGDAKLGDVVHGGDRIQVRGDGSVGISLHDETLISLGPNSTLVIDDFAFNRTTREGKVETSILRGTLRFVTGLIGRVSPQAIKVNTPVSTLGIRGTDFIVEVPDGH